MKNTLLFFAVMIFLFSCKKNKETEVTKNDLDSVAGSWTANYLNKSIGINIDGGQKFSMSIPVIVKKESNAAPVLLTIALSGVCIRQDIGYELRIDGLAATGGKQPNDTGLEEIRNLLFQSLEGTGIDLERTVAESISSARLTADNGKLMISGL